MNEQEPPVRVYSLKGIGLFFSFVELGKSVAVRLVENGIETALTPAPIRPGEPAAPVLLNRIVAVRDPQSVKINIEKDAHGIPQINYSYVNRSGNAADYTVGVSAETDLLLTQVTRRGGRTIRNHSSLNMKSGVVTLEAYGFEGSTESGEIQRDAKTGKVLSDTRDFKMRARKSLSFYGWRPLADKFEII